MISGFATREGTSGYFRRLHLQYKENIQESWYSEITGIDFFPSRVGSGTYRTHYRNRPQGEALRDALLGGFNVIDTASNYGTGGAEFLVGNVVWELFSSNRIRREEIVIITKGGYIQGKTKELFPETTFSKGIFIDRELIYSLDPEALRTQLEISLKRMQISSVDVFLLQNPEIYFFYYGKEEFLSQIHRVFSFLEEMRKEKKLRYYGISTSISIYPQDLKDKFPLEELISINYEGFRVFQIPANFLEVDFLIPDTQGLSFIDKAKRRNFWIVSTRPFYAIYDRKIIRFTKMPEDTSKDPETYLEDLEAKIYELEQKLLAYLEPLHFRFQKPYPSAYHTLHYYRHFLRDTESVYSFLQAVRVPLQKTVSYIRFLLETQKAGTPALQIWEVYLKYINGYLWYLPEYVAYKNHKVMEKIERELSRRYPQLQSLPLQLQILYILLSEGIHTVLAGMRKVNYVRQIQKVFSLPVEQKIIAGSW